MPRYRVTIVGRGYDAMADLVRRHGIAVVRQTARPLRGGRYRVQAFVSPDELKTLRKAGYDVDRHEDVEAAGRQRQAQAKQARARGARAMVRAGALPARYLDVAEVEATLASIAGPANAGFTQRFALPRPTWEGRTCHAIRIGEGAGGDRVGIYLLGGIHARE